ncbi:hypothetical protein L1D24_22410 [Vibrio brasiliensis]|uniref:hypothetical protein n=1 Tax=Vibrio brasiliensis TaxID=170652 RepID=UPI001EFD1F6A|nr:hypothetical protein [Vibrio brasiliensis]MCG9651277.1 hypothetical protein [Vibrio brasiliensis]
MKQLGIAALLVVGATNSSVNASESATLKFARTVPVTCQVSSAHTGEKKIRLSGEDLAEAEHAHLMTVASNAEGASFTLAMERKSGRLLNGRDLAANDAELSYKIGSETRYTKSTSLNTPVPLSGARKNVAFALFVNKNASELKPEKVEYEVTVTVICS